MLVHPLQKRDKVQMQSPRLLSLHAAENGIATTKDPALRFCAATKSILTSLAPFVAVRTVWAHADAEQPGEDNANKYGESVDGAEGVAGNDEPA